MIDLFRVLSGAAGLAGIAAGVVLLIYQEVIRKTVFSKLESHHAYNLLRLIIILTFAFGIFGTVIWTLDRSGVIGKAADSAATTDTKSEPAPTSVTPPPTTATQHVPSPKSARPGVTPVQPGIVTAQNDSQNGDEVIYQRTLAIIADDLDKPISAVKPETNLYSGSLSMVSLVVHLHSAFNLYIPDEDSFRFRTVRDVTDYVQKKMKMKMKMRPSDPHPVAETK